MPWDWIAENYLGIGSLELTQEKEDKVKQEIMSKIMPNMPYWKKITSTGEIEKLITSKLLKKKIDVDIETFLLAYKLAKMTKPQFQNIILIKYKKYLGGFNVNLYKNGKTVKVTKIPWKAQKPMSSGAKILKEATKLIGKPPKIWANKKMNKKTILEGKIQEVYQFHNHRKHSMKYPLCIACMAIRAFIQWEFHQPTKLSANDKTINVPKVGQLTVSELASEKSFTPKEIQPPPEESTSVGSLLVPKNSLSLTHVKLNPFTTIELTDDAPVKFVEPTGLSCTTNYPNNPCSCGQISLEWQIDSIYLDQYIFNTKENKWIKKTEDKKKPSDDMLFAFETKVIDLPDLANDEGDWVEEKNIEKKEVTGGKHPLFDVELDDFFEEIDDGLDG